MEAFFCKGGTPVQFKFERSVQVVLGVPLAAPLQIAQRPIRGQHHAPTGRVHVPCLVHSPKPGAAVAGRNFFFFFITLGLELHDTKVYEP